MRPRLVLTGTEALKKGAEAGLGIAFVSAYAVEREVSAGTLRLIPVADASFRRDYEVVSLKGRYLTPAVASFVAFACQYAARQIRVPPVSARPSRGADRRKRA